MGAKDRVDFAKRVGGSWTADQAVDDGGKVNFRAGGLCRGESDKFHLMYQDATNFDAVHKSLTLGSPDTLSSAENVNDNAGGGVGTVSAPVYYDDAGVERITAIWERGSDGNQYSSEIDDDGTPGAEEVITGTSSGIANCPAVDEKTVWFLWKGADSDLFSDSNVNSAGWGTDNEELDNITLNFLRSNIYQRGSDVVLAYVYEDVSTIRYNEKVLRTVSTDIFPELYTGISQPYPHKMEVVNYNEVH